MSLLFVDAKGERCEDGVDQECRELCNGGEETTAADGVGEGSNAENQLGKNHEGGPGRDSLHRLGALHVAQGVPHQPQLTEEARKGTEEDKEEGHYGANAPTRAKYPEHIW